MRALRLLLISVLACGVLVAFGSASGATVPGASKVCNIYKQLENDANEADPTNAKSFDTSAFKKIGAAYKSASKTAPPKVKAAMNSLASYYRALGGSEDAADAVKEALQNGGKVSKAITTIATYYETKCS